MYEQETRFGTSSMMTFVQTTILYMSEMCKIKKRMMKDAQYYDERERERESSSSSSSRECPREREIVPTEKKNVPEHEGSSKARQLPSWPC